MLRDHFLESTSKNQTPALLWRRWTFTGKTQATSKTEHHLQSPSLHWMQHAFLKWSYLWERKRRQMRSDTQPPWQWLGCQRGCPATVTPQYLHFSLLDSELLSCCGNFCFHGGVSWPRLQFCLSLVSYFWSRFCCENSRKGRQSKLTQGLVSLKRLQLLEV